VRPLGHRAQRAEVVSKPLVFLTVGKRAQGLTVIAAMSLLGQASELVARAEDMDVDEDSDVPLGNLTCKRKREMNADSGAPSGASAQVLVEQVEPPSEAKLGGEPVHQGPIIMVAIVGVPSGRWEKECMSGAVPTDMSAQFDDIVRRRSCSLHHGQRSAGGSSSCGSGQCDTSSYLYGFALLRSWTLSSVVPDSAQALAMMRSLQRRHSGSLGLDFLEHYVLHSAALTRPVVVETDAASGAQALSESPFASLAKTADMQTLDIENQKLDRLTGFARLVDYWKTIADFRDDLYTWPSWPGLAQIMAEGLWTVDVTAIATRMRGRHWKAPVQPPRRMLTMIRNSREHRVLDIVEANHEKSQRRDSVHDFKGRGNQLRKSQFSARHMMRSVEAAQHLSDQGQALKTAKSHLALLFPQCADQMWDDLKADGFDMPGRSLLYNASIRIDVAAMLAHRHLYQIKRPLFRYLASDASPQLSQSYEVFVTVERIVPMTAVCNVSMASVRGEDISQRLLPLVTLGYGRMDLASKAASQVIGEGK